MQQAKVEAAAAAAAARVGGRGKLNVQRTVVRGLPLQLWGCAFERVEFGADCKLQVAQGVGCIHVCNVTSRVVCLVGVIDC